MADTIDSISIELTASTESAENSIQRVIDMLRMLKAATIDASAESRIVKSIRSIAKAAKEVDTDAGQKLARLAGGLKALSKVGDLSNLADAGKNLSGVVRAVNSIGQAGGKGLSGLADGIKQTNDALGSIKDADVSKLNAVKDALSGEMSGSLHSSARASESAALGGMGTPEPSFGNMAAYGAMTVFKYTADSIRDATAAYREFASALSSGGTSIETQFSDSAMTVFTYVADSIRDATAAYQEFRAALGSGVPPVFTDFADSAAQAGESVRMLTGSVGGNNEGPWAADEIRDAARAYDDVGNSASKAADVIETEFVNPFANFKMKPLEDELPRVTLNPIDGSVADSVNNAAGAFGNLSSVLGGLSGVLGPVASGLIAIPKYFGGQLIKNIQSATKGLTGFFHSIVRIAKYRLIRTALRMITQGINEGIKNLYAFSQAAGGTFASSMNQIATASKYLGNSFAAMASPLVEALAPAIDFIVDKFVDMFNTISQIIARLTGKSTYTVAKKVASTWGDAAKSASSGAQDAADDIKRTIMGFDEINKLSKESSSSGGGGGGGGSGGGASSMFEEMPIDGAVSSFADSLKAAFEEGNWQELGELLGGKVNELVDSIDWAGAGTTVGYYINGWFSTKYWTLDTINFTNIGSKIAEFLNNAIKEIDFSIIGASLVQKLTIIGDTIIGFFTNFDWAQAATSFSAFVEGIYNEITKWLEKYDWTEIGNALATALIDVITNIDYAGISNSFYEAMSAAIEAGVELLAGFFDGLAEKFKAAINWDSLSDEVQAVVEGLMAVLGTATLAVGAILAFSGANIPLGIGLMAAGAVSLGTSLSLMWDGLSDKVKEKVELIKGIVSGALLVLGAVLTFSGANIGLGLGLLASGAIGLAGTLGANWDIIKEKLEGPIGAVTALISGATLVLGILALISGNIPIGLGLILAGTAGLATTVAANWDNLVNIGKTAIEKVKEGWETIKELVVNAVVSLVKKVGAWAEDVWAFIQRGAETIEKTVKAIGEGIATFATNVWLWIRNGAESVEKTVKAIGEGIATFATDVWLWIRKGADTIEKTVKVIGEGVATFATNVWQWIINGADTVEKTVKVVGEGIATFATNVWQWIINGADTVEKTVKAIGEGVATFATDVWLWIRNGTATVEKTVKAIGEGIATFATDVWLWIRKGADTVEKTVEAGMKKLDTWVDSVVDFILGPESSDKKANIAMAIENTALAIVNFLRDPVTAIKNVMLELGVKFAQGVEKFWNWITGQDGQSEVTVDAYGNFMIVPKAGEGLTDKGNGQFALTNDVAGTTVLTPEKSDNWEAEWDKLVGDEIDVKVKLNAVKGKVEDSIKTWFDNAGGTITTTISTLLTQGGTWLNTAWTALTTKDHKTTTTQSLIQGQGDNWNNNAWTAMTQGNITRQRTQQLKQSTETWDPLAETALTQDNIKRQRVQQLKQSTETWDPLAETALTQGNITRQRVQQLKQSTETWDSLAEKAMTLGNIIRQRAQNLIQGKKWIKEAWTALTKGNSSPITRVGLSKNDNAWSSNAWDVVSLSDVVNKTVKIALDLASGAIEGLKKLLGIATGGVIQNGRLTRFESGGIINNGFVRSLPHYAGGSTDAHGTLFVAGEAGPEILGHIGGRTEILNQSQLAATMFAAVRSAMGGVKIAATFYNGDASESSEADYEMMYRAMYDAFTDAMAPNAERDREKVALMRQIAAKEFTAEVTANSMNRAQTRMNRRAGTTIVPVGT